MWFDIIMPMVDILNDSKKEQPQFDGLIRTLVKEDIPALRPILATWIKDRQTGEPLPDEVEEDLQIMADSNTSIGDRNYLVAVDTNGEITGVIGFKDPDPRMLKFAKTEYPAELVNAYVKSDQRKGKGVGRALVSALEKLARETGYTEIILNSGPRYKDSGWGFYDKLEGYQRIGVSHEHYGEGGDAPVWEKQLPSITKEEILDEIDSHTRGQRDKTIFFNNLPANLPGGIYYNFSERILNTIATQKETSPKLRTITVREFLTECEDAVHEAGYTSQEVIDTCNKWREIRKSVDRDPDDQDTIAIEERYFNILTDVYVIMRLRGYNDFDLSA